MVSQKLTEHLSKVSRMVASKYRGNAGATFVGALVCEDETVIVNVGDSRAYTYDKKKIRLERRGEDGKKILAYYEQNFPHIVIGEDANLRRLFQKNYNAFLQLRYRT